MGVVTAGERSESPWTATILLNGRPVLFHFTLFTREQMQQSSLQVCGTN